MTSRRSFPNSRDFRNQRGRRQRDETPKIPGLGWDDDDEQGEDHPERKRYFFSTEKPKPFSPPISPPKKSPNPESDESKESMTDEIDRYWATAEAQDAAAPEKKDKKRNFKEPHVVERRKAANIAVENLVSLAKMGDAIQNYREMAAPIWSSISKSQLSDTCLKVMHEVPSACFGSFSLEFLCHLVHEAAHFYLLNTESRIKHDVHTVDDAIVHIVTELRKVIETRKCVSKCVELLAILCRLFSDLSLCNDRRPAMKKYHNDPHDVLYFFKSIPAVKCVLELLDLLLTYLLETAPELCTQTLITASRSGFHFVWVWVHVVSTFPSSIIRHLMWQGMQDFKAFVQSVTQCEKIQSASIAQKQQEEYHIKFTAIKEVIAVLAKRMNVELKSCALTMISNNLQVPATENGLEDMSMLFIMRLMANSPEILRFLIADVAKIVTPRNVLKAAQMLLLVDKKFIFPKAQTYLQFCTQSVLTLRALNNKILPNLVQELQEIAYEQQPDEFDPVLVSNVSAGATALLDELSNAILTTVYTDHGGKIVLDCNILNKYAEDEQLLQKAVNMMLTCGKSRVFHMKLLHALCLDSSVDSYTADVMSSVIVRCICTAENEEQLAVFVAFLETVIPFSPNCVRKAIATKGLKRERKALLSLTDFKRTNDLWFNNLKTLMEWERGADSKQTMKYMGTLMLEDWGLITNDFFNWALDSLAELTEPERRSDSNITAEVIKIATSVTSFVFASNQCGCSRIKHLYRLTAQIAAILVMVLRFVGMDHPKVGDAFESLLDCFMTRFMNNPKSRAQLTTHLLDEAFELSAELFGSCSNSSTWDLEEEFAAGCDNSNFDPFGIVNKANADDDDLLGQLQTLSCDSGRASQAAHSGILARKPVNGKHRRFNPDSDETLRRLIFLSTLRKICLIGPMPQDRYLFQHLAIELSQRFCGDASLGCYMWGEWDLERDQIAKYVKISKNFAESGIAGDMLTLISREVSLWYAYPLVKALLATVINDIESKSGRQRTCRLSPQMLKQVDSVFAYFVRGMLLPAKLICCMMKILARVTVHEASVVLVGMWKYLAAVAPNHHTMFVERIVATVADYGRFAKNTSHLAHAWRQSVTYLIQKYSKDLGRYVLLLKREHLLKDEENSDDWSIEYPPTYLVLPDMKR